MLAQSSVPAAQGQPSILPRLVQELLAEVRGQDARPDAVAVCVGPGSFTGIRTAIALAAGFAGASGIRLLGVTVADALRTPPPANGWPVWVALDSRRGHVFLATGEEFAAHDPRDPPRPPGPVSVAGDAAAPVAASLLARGQTARLSDRRGACARLVAAAAFARHEAGMPPRPAVPLYVDAPAVRPA